MGGMRDCAKEWNECAAICKFLAEHDCDVSKETRELLEIRLLFIIEGLRRLDNPPQPF